MFTLDIVREIHLNSLSLLYIQATFMSGLSMVIAPSRLIILSFFILFITEIERAPNTQYSFQYFVMFIANYIIINYSIL